MVASRTGIDLGKSMNTNGIHQFSIGDLIKRDLTKTHYHTQAVNVAERYDTNKSIAIKNLHEIANDYEEIADIANSGNAAWSYRQMAKHLRERARAELVCKRQWIIIGMLVVWLIEALYIR